ncbi:MAG: TonB-dependent siderophore receptor, partial [Pollutimonas bauzanensis]
MKLRTIASFVASLPCCVGAAYGQSASANPNGPVTSLETITVESSADASADGLAKPYAGGQVARGGRVGLLGTRDNMDTPFSISSYTNELIQDRQARSVG